VVVHKVVKLTLRVADAVEEGLVSGGEPLVAAGVPSAVELGTAFKKLAEGGVPGLVVHEKIAWVGVMLEGTLAMVEQASKYSAQPIQTACVYSTHVNR